MNPGRNGTIWNALRVALGMNSGKIIFKDMQARKICGFSGIVFSRMGVKESGLFSGRQTIWNALRVALGINSRKIILDFANPAGLRPRRICLFTGRVVPGSGIVAAVGLRPKRSENRCFYGMNPLRQSRKASPERVQSSTGSSFMPNNFSESRGSRCCN